MTKELFVDLALEFFVEIVSLALGILVALRIGDALSEKWAEKRRLREWAVIGEWIQFEIRKRIGVMYTSAGARGLFEAEPSFNFRGWLAHLEAIAARVRIRRPDGILTDADLDYPAEDSKAILGATQLGVEFAPSIAAKLAEIQMLYRDALPESVRRQLTAALIKAIAAQEHVKPLGGQPKRDFDIQATTNLRTMIEFFQAVNVLLQGVSPHVVPPSPRRGL